MMWTDDPVYDASMYDAEQEKILEQLPLCDECNERIQGEGYYEINGRNICPDCMQDHWRWIEI